MLWELTDGKNLYSLEAGDTVNALAFSPSRYWLCAATSSCIKSEFLSQRERGDCIGQWEIGKREKGLQKLDFDERLGEGLRREVEFYFPLVALFSSSTSESSQTSNRVSRFKDPQR